MFPPPTHGNMSFGNKKKQYWSEMGISVNSHCLKSVRVRSFSGPNAENTGQKNSEYGHFSSSVTYEKL